MSWFKAKHIIVPFDFSEEASDAVKLGLSLAESGAHLHVLHVIPQLTVTEPGVIWDTIDDVKRCEHARYEIEKALSALDIENVHLDVAVGDAGSVIAHTAEDIEAGLIIIPSHGRTGLKRLLLGSVAERVVRLAKCPVLVLKKGKGEVSSGS